MWSVVNAKTGKVPDQRLLGPRSGLDNAFHAEVRQKILAIMEPVMPFIIEKVCSCKICGVFINILQVKAKLPSGVYEKLEIIADSLLSNPRSRAIHLLEWSSTSQCRLLLIATRWTCSSVSYFPLANGTAVNCVFTNSDWLWTCGVGTWSYLGQIFLTHFNLEYSGTRCSLVFSTDKHLSRWSQDRSGHAVVGY